MKSPTGWLTPARKDTSRPEDGDRYEILLAQMSGSGELRTRCARQINIWLGGSAKWSAAGQGAGSKWLFVGTNQEKISVNYVRQTRTTAGMVAPFVLRQRLDSVPKDGKRHDPQYSETVRSAQPYERQEDSYCGQAPCRIDRVNYAATQAVRAHCWV